MITFVFSMRGPTLTDQQASAFRAYAQWRVVNERGGRLLVDGVAETVTGAGTTGGSNYGNHAWYFGARGGSSLYFSGDDYGGALYAIKAAGADRAAIEAFVANRTGVTL